MDVCVKLLQAKDIFMISLSKDLQLTIVDKSKKSMYRVTVDDALVENIKKQVNVESTNKAFFELFKNALIAKHFSVDREVRCILYRNAPCHWL